MMLRMTDGTDVDGHHRGLANMATRIEAARVPLSPAAQAALEGEPGLLASLLTGGDDYELVFALSPEREAEAARLAERLALPLTRIGAFGPGEGVEVVDRAEALRVAANHLGDDLRAACGADKQDWSKGLRHGDALIHEFTPAVRRLLSGLQKDPGRTEEAARAWRAVARRTALDIGELALDAAPPGAFLGRVDGNGYTHRLSVAEARYRAAITKQLGPPPDDLSDPPGPEPTGPSMPVGA